MAATTLIPLGKVRGMPLRDSGALRIFMHQILSAIGWELAGHREFTSISGLLEGSSRIQVARRGRHNRLSQGEVVSTEAECIAEFMASSAGGLEEEKTFMLKSTWKEGSGVKDSTWKKLPEQD